MKLELTFLIFVLFAIKVADSEAEFLYFGFINTITGAFTTNGSIPIVDMVLNQTNNRSDILGNYTLSYTKVLDSKCHRSVSLDAFFEIINNDTTIVSVLGCGCSVATLPVAEISHYWNIPQLSFASGTSELNDRHRFRNFFRILPSLEYTAPSFAQLMREFGWRKMAIITQEEGLFTGITDSLYNIFKSQNWTLDASVKISSREKSFSYFRIFDNIKINHYRIININTYPNFAFKILCEAYYREIYGPDYVWIIPMWYNANWWITSVQPNISCNNSLMIQVLNGTIGTLPEGYFLMENKTKETFSGLSPQEFTEQYRALFQLPQYEKYTEHALGGLAYDAAWSFVLGLDKATKKIAKGNDSGCENVPGDLVPLEYFNYTNKKLGCIMSQSFSEVQFIGVTGPVIYNENGSRPDNVLLVRQYRLTSNESIRQDTIGRITIITGAGNDTFTFSTGESNNRIWQTGQPPYDGSTTDKIDSNHLALLIIYNSIALCGVIFAIVCFIFNIAYRNKKVIKLTSPNLNYLIILGAIMLYICIVFFTYSTSSAHLQTVFCNIRIWLFSLGYTLCFAVILSKTWRIYYIFNNPKPQKKVIKDWMLFILILVIVLIDLVIIAISLAFPHAKLISSKIEDLEHQTVVTDEGRFMNNFIFICTQPESTIWLSISFGYKGLLQLVAVFMAFHTRRVKVKALNDSKEIAAIIYINSIILALLVVTEFALAKYHNIYAAVFGLALLIEGSLFLGLTFIPKMITLFHDPKGEKVFTGSYPTESTTGTVTFATSDENVTNLKKKIEELELKIKKLEGNDETH